MGAASPAATSSGKSSSGKQSTPYKDAVMKQLGDGKMLNSDLDGIISKYGTYLAGLDGDTDMDPMQAIMMQRDLARGLRNAEDFANAYKHVENNHAGADIALDTYGRMYIQDPESGEVSTISIDKYDPSKHIVLTNNDLATVRKEYMPESNDFHESLNRAVSMNDIQDKIQKLVRQIGTMSITQDLGMSPEVVKAAEAIGESLNASATEMTVKTVDPRDYDLFARYVKDTLLDSNERKQVEAVMASQGYDPNNKDV